MIEWRCQEFVVSVKRSVMERLQAETSDKLDEVLDDHTRNKVVCLELVASNIRVCVTTHALKKYHSSKSTRCGALGGKTLEPND